MAVDTLRVAKGAGGTVVLTFSPPESACALGTSVFASPTVRPVTGGGLFPDDPPFTDRTAEDADPGAPFAHVPPAGTVHYLVVERLPDGTHGPSGHYGN